MIGAIVQARMGARRLPGKVLKEVDGVPLLKFQYERILKSRKLEKIIIATTTSPQDDAVAAYCEKNKIPFFRGSEHDVLSRYFECAKENQLDTVVRLTADCPLIDPEVIDQTIEKFQTSGADYTGNTIPPESSHFPDGSDVEVFSFSALEKANRDCKDVHFREHVTFYFWKTPGLFKTSQLLRDSNDSKFRLTVDYPEDLEVVGFLIQTLRKMHKFGHLDEVLELLKHNPEIREKNSQYHFGIGWKQHE